MPLDVRPDSPATIGEEWASYLAEVVPADAPEVQREECKRAFYAGAQAMFSAVLAAAEPEDEGVCESHMEALHREMQDWLRLFKKREGI